jgi:hypothetical protein
MVIRIAFVALVGGVSSSQLSIEQHREVDRTR